MGDQDSGLWMIGPCRFGVIHACMEWMLWRVLFDNCFYCASLLSTAILTSSGFAYVPSLYLCLSPSANHEGMLYLPYVLFHLLLYTLSRQH